MPVHMRCFTGIALLTLAHAVLSSSDAGAHALLYRDCAADAGAVRPASGLPTPSNCGSGSGVAISHHDREPLSHTTSAGRLLPFDW